jgi:hypothetical protein
VNHNPYSPPSARVADAAEAVGRAGSTARLYTSGQIALAAFLGSPLAAAWFASANFKALAQPFKATRTMYLGVGLLITVLCISFVLPDSMPNSILPIAYSLGIRYAAEPYFKEPIREHVASGGKLGSWWKVVGLSLLVSMALVLLIVVVAVALASLHPDAT